jgi:hypothetical protein
MALGEREPAELQRCTAPTISEMGRSGRRCPLRGVQSRGPAAGGVTWQTSPAAGQEMAARFERID